MKTRCSYFKDFFTRVSNDGFSVKTITERETDLIAEVYHNKSLFCSISQEGEVFYEYYDAEQLQKIEDCSAKSRNALNFCSLSPFLNHMSMLKAVTIAECAYWVVAESTSMALLYRFSGLFGYEFATCKKSLVKVNRRNYYCLKRFYCLDDTCKDFYNRSGVKLCFN